MTSLSDANMRRRGDSDATIVPGGSSGGRRTGRRPRSESNSTVSIALRRVTSFADLEERLEETGKMIASDDSSSEGSNDGDGDGEGRDESFEEITAEEEAEYRDRLGGLGLNLGTSSFLETGREDWKDDDGGESNAGSEARFGRSGENSALSSVVSSRVQSRNVSTSVSREVSPRRNGGETFSTRAVRFSGTHHIVSFSFLRFSSSPSFLLSSNATLSPSQSPYNTSNPYYGYPAFVPPTSLDPTGVPRPHFHRRRKRDLLRTLTYLAVLRFLALHRQIRWKLSLLLAAILGIVGLRKRNGEERNSINNNSVRRTVRWQEPVWTAARVENSSRVRSWFDDDVDEEKAKSRFLSRRFLLTLLAFVILRSPVVASTAEAVLVGVPKKVVAVLVGSRNEKMGQGGRKRDVLMKGLLMGLKGGRVGGTRDRIRNIVAVR